MKTTLKTLLLLLLCGCAPRTATTTDETQPLIYTGCFMKYLPYSFFIPATDSVSFRSFGGGWMERESDNKVRINSTGGNGRLFVKSPGKELKEYQLEFLDPPFHVYMGGNHSGSRVCSSCNPRRSVKDFEGACFRVETMNCEPNLHFPVKQIHMATFSENKLRGMSSYDHCLTDEQITHIKTLPHLCPIIFQLIISTPDDTAKILDRVVFYLDREK